MVVLQHQLRARRDGRRAGDRPPVQGGGGAAPHPAARPGRHQCAGHGPAHAPARPAGRTPLSVRTRPTRPPRYTTSPSSTRPSPARPGEMVSDHRDLQRFLRALLTGRLLPAEQMRELTRTVPAGSLLPGAEYGMGLMKVELSCGKEVWGHSGGIHGSLSVAVSTRSGDHTLAANFNGDWAGRLDRIVEAEFCGTTARADTSPLSEVALR
ncbi:beta-lactamase family protein [Streptomyces somaliensis]|nr:beta-lactamase family protein [Streptomyces somaliensis]